MPGFFEKVDKKMLLGAALAGLAAGAFSLFYLMALQGLGQNPFGKFKYVLISVYALFFAFALWRYRATQPGFRMRIREGLIVGIVLNIVATLVFYGALYWLLGASSGIGHDMLEAHRAALMQLYESTLPQAAQLNLSEADMAHALANIKSMTGADLAFDQLDFYYGFGMVNALLMSLIFKH